VSHEAKIWSSFYDYWLEASTKVQTMIVRYEDLLSDEANTMKRILEFMRRGATPVPETLDYQAKVVASLAPGYSPKKSTRRVGKALLKMTEEQIASVCEVAGKHMINYGYSLCRSEGGITDKESIEKEIEGVSLLVSPSMNQEVVYPACSPTSVFHQEQQGMMINTRTFLREEHDFFGRRMTDLRKSLTDSDTKPFPVAS